MPDDDKNDTNVGPEDKADESQAGDEGAEAQKAEGDKPKADEPKAKAPEPTADDKAWADLRKLGHSAEYVKELAGEGYTVREAAKKAKAEAAEAEQSKASEDDGEYEPMSKAEVQKQMKEMRAEMQKDMQMTSQAAINHSTISAALNSSAANDNPQAREIVSAMVYKKMANGEALDSAINASLDEYKGFISGQQKAFFKKKVAATAATGGIPAGEPVLAPIPDFKHAASDFQDGTAHEQAMEVIRLRQQS